METLRLFLFLLVLLIGGGPVLAGVPENLSRDITENYCEIVYAGYADAIIEARKLHAAAEDLIYEVSPASLESARQAWIAAWSMYLQTEALVFDKGLMEEGKEPANRLNGWPVDEAAIDYTDTDPHAGIINNRDDVSPITESTLADLNPMAKKGQSVTGYHAIEFLLWGRDGKRPVTDYSDHPNADRRKAYLISCVDLLIRDLDRLLRDWQTGVADNSRDLFTAGDPTGSIGNILTGMARSSLLETNRQGMPAIANEAERTHAPDYSENRLREVEHRLLGIRNIWLGEYTRLIGTMIKGAGIKDLVASVDPVLAEEIDRSLRENIELLKGIPDMEKSGNTEALSKAARSLENLAGLIVRAGALFELPVSISE